MKLYRKKPIAVEAVQIPEPGPEHAVEGQNLEQWLRKGRCEYTIHPDAKMCIRTLEGWMTAQPGDFIIKGFAGEFYPCAKAVFVATYERTNRPQTGTCIGEHHETAETTAETLGK